MTRHNAHLAELETELSKVSFNGPQDPHTAILKGPQTPWISILKGSKDITVFECYVSAAVYVKFSRCFKERHLGQNLKLARKQMTTKQTGYRMHVSRDIMRPETRPFQFVALSARTHTMF